MRTFAGILVILFALSISAQAQSKLSYTQGIGFETNIFKNPASFASKGDSLEREEMYQNGIFSYHRLLFSTKYKKDNLYLRFKSNASAQLFPTVEDAHAYRLSLELPLRYKLGSGKYVHMAPKYARYQQNGLDLSSGAIRTPLSYASFTLPIDYEFDLGNSEYKTGAFYKYKNYPSATEDVLYYHSIGAHVSKENEFDIAKKEYLGLLDVETSFRRYQDIDFPTVTIEDPELEDAFWDDLEGTERIRNWAYLQASYRLKRRFENGYWEVPFRSFVRADFSTQKYGYLQHDLGFNISYKTANAKWLVKTKLAHRHHFKLMNEDSVSIRYVYAGIDLRYEADLSKKLSCYANLEIIKRFSTQQKQSTLAFREYYNSQFSVGLRYSLF